MRRNLSLRTLVILFDRSQARIGRNSTPQSLYYCLFAPHIYGVILRAHPVRGESHIQRNANGEVVTELSTCQHRSGRTDHQTTGWSLAIVAAALIIPQFDQTLFSRINRFQH